MKIIDLQKGLTFFRTAEDSVFYKNLKSIFDYSHIPFADPCCDDEQTVFPVRANTAGDNTLEYWNGTTWAAFTFDATLADIVATTVTASTNVITNEVTEFTGNNGVTVDGALIKDGGISANSMYAGFFPTPAAQALSGAGAVNITSYLTKYTSTGAAQALTLASGSQIGQRKKVVHVVDGGSGILTAVYVGGTTITFTTVAEFADLMWTGTAWAVLELGNSAVPGTPPALA